MCFIVRHLLKLKHGNPENKAAFLMRAAPLCNYVGWMRFFGPALALICAQSACGEFNNWDVRDAIGQVCGQQNPIQIEPPLFADASVDLPWAGWLVAKTATDTGVTWRVDGLPEGLSYDAENGLLAGRPSQGGDFEFQATATLLVPGCPPIQASKVIQLTVKSTEGQPNVPLSQCDSLKRGKVTAYVWDQLTRKPKATFAGDGLSVIESNLLLAPDVKPTFGATHRMLLSNPKSLIEKQVEVRYALPGGVHLPLNGAKVDLRYFRGEFGDSYFFLTRNGHPRFVVYDGYLGANEIMARCPNSFGFHCALPLYSPVQSECEIEATCDSRRAMAFIVEELKKGLAPEEVALLPGRAVLQANNTLLRLVDSWEWTGALSCDANYPILYRHGFYVLPLGKEECTYAEAYVGDGSGTVPVSNKPLPLTGQLMYPGAPAEPRYSWFVEPPKGPGLVVPTAEYAFEQPGDYIITLVATAIYHDKQFGIFPCGVIPQAGNISAQIRVKAVQEDQ
jgi:hypothetical protein